MHHHRPWLRGRLELGGPGPHARVDDALQAPPGRFVGEDPRAHRGAVQRTVGGQQPRPEGGDDLGQALGAGGHDLPGQQVRVDHDGAELGQDRRDRALAGGDTAGEADPGDSWVHAGSIAASVSSGPAR